MYTDSVPLIPAPSYTYTLVRVGAANCANRVLTMQISSSKAPHPGNLLPVCPLPKTLLVCLPLALQIQYVSSGLKPGCSQERWPLNCCAENEAVRERQQRGGLCQKTKRSPGNVDSRRQTEGVQGMWCDKGNVHVNAGGMWGRGDVEGVLREKVRQDRQLPPRQGEGQNGSSLHPMGSET